MEILQSWTRPSIWTGLLTFIFSVPTRYPDVIFWLLSTTELFLTDATSKHSKKNTESICWWKYYSHGVGNMNENKIDRHVYKCKHSIICNRDTTPFHVLSCFIWSNVLCAYKYKNGSFANIFSGGFSNWIDRNRVKRWQLTTMAAVIATLTYQIFICLLLPEGLFVKG